MTAKNLQNFKTYLEDTGFVQSHENIFAWREDEGRAPQRKQLPWHIAGWNLQVQGADIVQVGFEARLRRDALLLNIEDLLSERFESFRSVVLQADSKTGYWLLLEFLDKDLDADQSRLIEDQDLQREQLPHGLAGMHITVIQALGQLSVFMTKHFFLGNVPGKLFIEFPKLLNEALFGHTLKGLASFHAYICTIGSEHIRSSLIQASQFPEFILQQIQIEGPGSDSPFQQVRLQLKESGWSLHWSQDEDLPELVVPPIEVLEQKEVARRFQSLDELILAEDYSKALQQCREYLEKFPQSLYLIRRWSFLTLWAGLPFERQYLEIMSKYDPQNLMTLSLWIRVFQLDHSPDSLLENLSRLGNNLGHSIEDFDKIDITSLTLPEMLGDAWNEKDDQRAVSCYERVLQTRGEIPRILVKLIRLMREVADPQAEESYMDRLLACEVPIRTRAAIYYRLAEIKQGIDQEEAAQWALKSWQTNRAQARYALLAADLLIDLGRAHEAVHVLVETSELQSKEAAKRTLLDLELKIAGIWLEQLQRYDLALERLERSRELADDEPEVYDRILELSQKLGESGMQIEVLIRALQVAIKGHDHERASSAVDALMEIAAELHDPDRQGEIYRQVLTCSLLDVEQIENIMSHSEIRLPYLEIIQAIERQMESVSPVEQGRYYQLLGDIARRFLQDGDLTRRYYELALKADCMSQLAFDFLDEMYARLGLNEQRYQLLKKRFELAPDAEKHVILRELFYFDEGVDGEERDRYAIQLFQYDPDDVGPLEERIAVYEQQGAALAISTLLEQLIMESRDTYGLLPLLRHGVEALHGMPYEGRFQLIDHLLQKMHELQHNPVEHAQFALQYLWGDPDKAYVKPYIEYLISLGEVPPYDAETLLQLLDDQQPKIELLSRLADRGDIDERTSYLRQAYRIARNIQGAVSQKLEIVTRLGELIALQDDELTDTIKSVRQTGKYDFVIGLIAHQMRLTRENNLRERLSKFACEFLESHQHRAEQLAMLKFSLEHLHPDQRARIKLIWLEHIGLDPELHTEEFAVSTLRQPSCWEYQNAICILLREMVLTWHAATTAESIVTPVLKIFMDDSHEAPLRSYLENLEPLGLINEQTAYGSFEYFSRQRDLLMAERYWKMTIRRAASAGQVHGMLQSSQELWHGLGLEQPFQEMLAELSDPSQGSQFKSEVYRELKLYLGEQLVLQRRDLRRAQTLLEQVYASHQDEVRTWAPLIVIYREFNAETDLYELLYRTLPLLRKQREQLRIYDLEFDALESELIDIAQRLGLKSEQDDGIADVDYDSLQFGTEVSRPARLDGGPSRAYVDGSQAQSPLTTKSQPGAFSLSLGDDEPLLRTPPAIPSDDGFATASLQSRDFSLSNYVYEAGRNDPMETQVGIDPPLRPASSFARDVSTLLLPSEGDDYASPQAPSPAAPIDWGTDPAKSLPGHHLIPDVPSRDNEVPPPPPDGQTMISSRLHQELAVNLDQMGLTQTPKISPTQSFVAERAHDEIRPPLHDPEEWRIVAAQGKAKEGLCSWLMQQAFSDKCEQHVAVQIAALFEENMHALKQWPHQVWRDVGELFYELRWADRMGREQFHPGIKSPLSRLLKTLYPIVQHQFVNMMNIKGIAERMKVRSDELLKIRRPLDWKDEVIQRGGLRFYAKYLMDNGYHLFHWSKMEDRFHFDFEKRDIYIDRDHYLNVPPSHLFHRLAFLSRAIGLEYYPYLHLSPNNDIFPFLMKCRRSLEQGRMDGVRRMLGMEKDPLKLMLSQADRDYIEQLFVEVGSLSPDKITKIAGVYVDQIYRLNIAESLDVIGLIESISNIDLFRDRVSPLAVIQQSAAIRALIAFAAELKFGHRSQAAQSGTT